MAHVPAGRDRDRQACDTDSGPIQAYVADTEQPRIDAYHAREPTGPAPDRALARDIRTLLGDGFPPSAGSNAPVEGLEQGGEARALVRIESQRVVSFFDLSKMDRETYIEILASASAYAERQGMDRSELEDVRDVPAEVPYIDMAFIDGNTLQSYLDTSKFEPTHAVNVARVAAAGESEESES